MRKGMRLACAAWAMLAGQAMVLDARAETADADAERQPIVVTAPGGAIDADDALHLTGADIGRAGAPDLLGALTRSIAGVTLQDAQGNPWQPNLVYRGFTASPLQGQAQGWRSIWTGRASTSPLAIPSPSICCRRRRFAASPCLTAALSTG